MQRKSLVKRLYWTILGPIVIALGCFVILWVVNTAHSRQQADTLARTQLALHSDRFRAEFNHIIDSLTVAAQTKAIQSTDLKTVLTTLKEVETPLKPRIEGLYYSLLDGTLYSTDGRSYIANNRYFPSSRSNNTYVITRAIKSRFTGHDVLLILVPFNDKNGNRLGSICAAIPIDSLISTSNAIRIANDDMMFLSDGNGRVVVCEHNEYSNGLLSKDQSERFRPFLNIIEQKRRNTNGVEASRVDFEHQMYSYYQIHITNTPWVFGIAQSDSSVFLSRNITAYIGFLTLLIIAVVSLLINRSAYLHLIIPLIDISNVMKRFRKGSLQERFPETGEGEIGRLASDLNRLAAEFEMTALKDRSIVNSATVSIISTNVDGVITQFNRSSERILGYRADEVIDKETPLLFHDQDEVQLARLGAEDPDSSDLEIVRNETLKHGDTGREWTFIRKNGTRAFLQLVMTPLVGSGGDLQGYLMIGRDITDLKESERCFKQLMDLSPLGMIIIRNEEFIYANQQMCLMIGYDHPQIIGKNILDFIADDAKDQVAEYLLRFREFGEYPKYVVSNGVRSDGTVFAFEAHISDVVYLGSPARLAIFTDITERQNIEREKEIKRTRNEQYSKFLTDLARHLGASIRDTGSSIRYATEETSRLLQSSRVSVWLYTDQYKKATCVDSYNSIEREHDSSLQLDSRLLREYVTAHLEGAVVAIDNVYDDRRTKDRVSGYLQQHNIQSLMGVPIWYDGALKGLLSLEVTSEARKWELDDQQFAMALASVIAVCLESNERQRAEQALRESENNLKTLINSMPDIICFKDGEGRWMIANEFSIELFGLEAVDYQGMKDSELAAMNGFYGPVFLRNVESDELAWTCDRFSRKVEVIPKPDGTELSFDIIRVPVFEDDGSRKGLIVVGRDISDRMNAEKRLNDLLERVQVLSSNLPDGFLYEIAAKPDGTRVFTYISDGIETLAGCKAEDVYKNPSLVYDWILPEDMEGLAIAEQKAIREKRIFQYEARVRSQSGEVRWMFFSSAPRSGPDGLILFDGVGLDITDRRKAQESLLESEKRWQFALEGAGDGVYDWDLVKQKVFYSQQLKRMLGYGDEDWTDTPEEAISRYHPDDEDRVRSLLSDMIAGDLQNISCEYRMRCKNGAYKWILDRGMILTRDDFDLPTRIIGTYTDITDRLEYEERIRMLNADLEGRVEARTHELAVALQELESFSYSISHDLRAPLRAIDGYSRILVSDHSGQLTEDAEFLLGRICNSARTMGRLIDDLLAFSRVGRAAIQKEIIDLTALFEEVRDQLLNDDPSPIWTINIQPKMSVVGDPVLIRQVVQNLLANAMKFSSHKDKPMINASLEDNGQCVRCAVSDNGAGFDMAYVDRMFGVFQRLHSATDFEGTGVGLAIVKRIVERHGGMVTAEGALEKGAKIVFTLPKD